ncbi:MAG: hypothetical protein GMKNLPBB_00899 [Myxococcota bacterium]|nr:hypothetical protein [Myxococcota bacterium]
MPQRPKVFRDPIHNLIALHKHGEAVILDLIAAPEFQRLRHIRQLGLSWVSYPGAEHSRFTHALGVFHLARRALNHLRGQIAIDPEDYLATLCAALLHDIGHGPFSHLFEALYPEIDHEAETLRLIEPDSRLGQVLLRHGGRDLQSRVAAILSKKHRPVFLCQLVSSQLDVDRFDYLLRDSHMTGAGYGRYDLEWLLHCLVAAPLETPSGTELVLAVDGLRGLNALEQHLLGRHFMYRHVYFHKTTRSAEMIVKFILRRFSDLAKAGSPPPGAPPALEMLARGEPLPPGALMRLNDNVMIALFQQWAENPGADGVLQDLCRRLLERRLFKTIETDPADSLRVNSERDSLQALVWSGGFDPDYYLILDEARDVAYKDVTWQGREGPYDTVFITGEAGGLRPLTRFPGALAGLMDSPYHIARWCLPGDHGLIERARERLRAPDRLV